MNWQEFFNMGGYAFYVWSSWGLATVIFAYLLLQTKFTKAKVKRTLKRQYAREQLAKN